MKFNLNQNDQNDNKKVKKSKKQIIRRSVSSILLVNMLCLSLVPPMASASNTLLATATNQSNQKTDENKKTEETPKTEVKAKTSLPSVQSLDLKVKAAILIEASSGQVLLNVNGDEALPPASMTKMMTEYIVADLVKKGEHKWDEMVTVRKNAAQTIGSRIFLAEGDQHTIEKLYIAMAVGSANDATVALAEHIAGSEQAFVKMMNEEAKRMGMTATHFANSSGLDISDMPADFQPADKKETVMSARDAATLARYIVTDHPDFDRFTKIQSYKFRERDKKPIVNWNYMLEANKNIVNFKQFAYEGLDGLKTGHTTNAGGSFTGTAKRNGMRLISVVMGTKGTKTMKAENVRFVETAKVLDYGFNNFETKQVVAPKATVAGNESVTVKRAKDTTVPIVSDEAVTFVVPKGADLSSLQTKVTLNDPETLVAPLKVGTVVGSVTYTYKDAGMDQPLEKTVNLITAQEAEKAGWFTLLLRAIGEFFADLFNGIKNLF